MAVESGWNEQALLSAFQNGLNWTIGREIALRKEQLPLDEAISTAINISDLMSQWRADSLRTSEPPIGGGKDPRRLSPGTLYLQPRPLAPWVMCPCRWAEPGSPLKSASVG